MFLAGVIPGPKEPPLTLKQYLSLLVDECIGNYLFAAFSDPFMGFPGGRFTSLFPVS